MTVPAGVDEARWKTCPGLARDVLLLGPDGADLKLRYLQGPLHFAGEHTSLKHSWIEGALESAVRVALETNGLQRGGPSRRVRGVLLGEQPQGVQESLAEHCADDDALDRAIRVRPGHYGGDPAAGPPGAVTSSRAARVAGGGPGRPAWPG